MCGINGFNFKNDDLIKKMMFFTKNRGPDFNDYISRENITLGHDRLSILDLNKRSNQPYKFKQFILSFNGEIYIYFQLKKELQPFLHDVLNKNYYDNSKNYLNFNNIENLLKRHKEEYHNPHIIWSLVTFQIFLKKFKL